MWGRVFGGASRPCPPVPDVLLSPRLITLDNCTTLCRVCPCPSDIKVQLLMGRWARQRFQLVLHMEQQPSLSPTKAPHGSHDFSQSQLCRQASGIRSGGGGLYVCIFLMCLSFESPVRLRAHPLLWCESPALAPGPVPLAPLSSLNCLHYRCPRELRGLKLGHAGTDNDKVQTL